MLREFMSKFGVREFDVVRLVLRDGSELVGVVLPKPEVGDPNVMVVKLDNGYNVGIHISNIAKLEVQGHVESPMASTVPIGKFVRSEPTGLPRVRLVATGGTIMSKVDYRTGAVYPSFSLEDLYTMYPEIKGIADLELLNLMAIFSEDMTPRRWSEMAEAVYKAFMEGVEGVVVLHGTDTMHYSAAAMSFAIRNPPGPVAFVGSQRSSDRPSSDAFENLLAAVLVAARAPFAGSVLVMHAGTSDGLIAVHRGTRVRKMHTSRRDTFISINSEPLAYVDINKLEIKMNTSDFRARGKPEDTTLMNKFDDKVALVKFYPGMDPEILHFLIDRGYHGIVIEGTGFGHVRAELLDPIKRAIDSGIPVVITSQTIFGRVNLNVYRRGVELLRLGVIPGEDMIPEVAFVKLSWVLAQTKDMNEVRRLMLTPIDHEISPRSEVNTYINKVSNT
ncbi:Glu-tRNA(Gln) amidotransferase subunit GatD [Vulcanisaeta thermophila]|uniref:Glu-tRNA(Gln) amidotransferase subunit GatD n=1 Tax=Vulcanisaeta thermophila TaxID=867917 RepID=UPI001EE3496B|nr:Glu-tRNA(Gln) amidotransferase subunit GatD [Vulcanisaeta thermophila]